MTEQLRLDEVTDAGRARSIVEDIQSAGQEAVRVGHVGSTYLGGDGGDA